jgi:hypothetical protein
MLLFAATPCKFTPGKSHRILAPETPNLKNGSRRKSDGTLCITESPDVDLIKQTKTTPRRMAASLALHKKKSFYSGMEHDHVSIKFLIVYSAHSSELRTVNICISNCSGDLNTEHPNTRNIRKLDDFYSSTVGIRKQDKSGIQIVVCFALNPDHSKSGHICPVFEWSTKLDHLYIEKGYKRLLICIVRFRLLV